MHNLLALLQAPAHLPLGLLRPLEEFLHGEQGARAALPASFDVGISQKGLCLLGGKPLEIASLGGSTEVGGSCRRGRRWWHVVVHEVVQNGGSSTLARYWIGKFSSSDQLHIYPDPIFSLSAARRGGLG